MKIIVYTHANVSARSKGGAYAYEIRGRGVHWQVAGRLRDVRRKDTAQYAAIARALKQIKDGGFETISEVVLMNNMAIGIEELVGNAIKSEAMAAAFCIKEIAKKHPFCKFELQPGSSVWVLSRVESLLKTDNQSKWS